jgi:nucleotidyltransferase substrate binding protein (TIGR01987 family)
MDPLDKKHTQLLQALKMLNISLTIFERLKQAGGDCNVSSDRDEAYRIHRDSIIQRFEYSIELFCEYLEKYLEITHLLTGIYVTRDVVREAYSVGIIKEEEAEKILQMVKDRNMTSHIYVEEIAEQLASAIPGYYQVMQTVAQRLIPN